jgi:hypothetical protein
VIDGLTHVGIGHRVTNESRAIFYKLFECDDDCFNELISGERSLTPAQVNELFDYDIDIYVDRTVRLFPSYDSYPTYIKMALVSAVYRGEMKAEHETVKLINGDLNDLGISSEYDRWRRVAAEYVNRDDYRKASPEDNSLHGIVIRMDANRDSFLEYAVELKEG